MRILLFILVLLYRGVAPAQAPAYNFRHLNAAQGLPDGAANVIGQDKYGYIWIGTLSGLSRFDGYTVTTFYNNAEDSTSLPAGTVRAITGDTQGRLWIGTDEGLVQYDFTQQHFLPARGVPKAGVYKIAESSNGRFYLLTTKGVMDYNPTMDTSGILPLERWVRDLFLKNDVLYVATDDGLVRYHTGTKTVQVSQTPDSIGTALQRVCVDGRDNIWCTTNRRLLVKADRDFGNFQAYDTFQYSPSGNAEGSVNQLLIDQKGGLWCVTNINGLAHYDDTANRFVFFRNDPLRPSSLSTNLISNLFQSSRGFIWIATGGYGVDYLHPDQNLFQTLLPSPEVVNKMPGIWSRALEPDRQGRYWMGFGGSMVRMDGRENYTLYMNQAHSPPQLHAGSIRSLLCDRDGNMWIGTADGMNRWEPATQKLMFLDERDSLPKDFYWDMLQDSHGTIWFGGRDNLRYLDPAEKKVRTVAAHPVLSPLYRRGVRTLFEDSKHRLWFGMNGTGLVQYDPLKKLVTEWKRKPGSPKTVISNQIVAIAEDNTGVMWFSSFAGLMSYDERIDEWKWYTQRDGLPSLKTSGLIVDAQNRLWIATTAGLAMLDQKSKTFKTFDLQDGLPTMEFSDMAATRLPDGRAVFPTIKGFVAFRPEQYKDNSRGLEAFISSLQTTGRTGVQVKNPEDLKTLKLKWDQNFFTLQLTAFNYDNPDQTWYAYKLDGFDNDWTYTKNRFVNYTNVPGGTYTFRYKATGDPNNWRGTEKTLEIRIGTVFYKALWFWALIALLTIATLYYLYQYRMQQQRRIFQLQTKAQALEKEKASVMYEGLKQQLNPHFLFNSLTSLNSLIKTDPRQASSFLNGMSKIYRYILSNRDVELVPLQDEIAFVEHYIQLQQARFETGLKIFVDVDESCYHKKIVPVTLQNLIENALKHNIIDEESPLVIRIFTESGWLLVQNNLQKKGFVETSNKQGLVNLKSLYRYLSAAPLEIIETETHFTIKIPLL